MRGLSDAFLKNLNDNDGLLHPILQRVQHDDTLMLAIRDNYINIYYRGGNLLRIKEQGKGAYAPSFDNNYNNSGKAIPVRPATIKNKDDAEAWVGWFPHLKEIMDFYFSKKSRSEREFQQLIARENNRSTISNESEYFISDIEFADSGLRARFDMLAIRWLVSHRKDGSNCLPALIEVKYGDSALGGSAGLLKHLQDIDELISDTKKYQSLLQTMESQFNQLDALGMLSYKRCSNRTTVKLAASNKPEVIFILANHNPRSTKLSTILNDDVVEYGKSTHFDLKFFVASFAGYGLHADCMFTLDKFREFRELLKSSKVKQGAAVLDSQRG